MNETDRNLSRTELLNAVRDVPEVALRAQNKDGWSILHVLEHLYLMETDVAARVQQAMQSPGGDAIPPQPLQARVLDRSFKVKTPSSASPTGQFQTLDEAMAHLDHARQGLEAAVGTISQEDLYNHGFPHVFFGMLSIQQWLDIVALHERRHTAQIEEMKSNQM